MGKRQDVRRNEHEAWNLPDPYLLSPFISDCFVLKTDAYNWVANRPG